MTIYYVRPTNGSDASAGTSFGAAWQTTQKAADVAVAGDEVRLCAEADEVLAASTPIDFDTNAGAYSSYIRFVGADAVDGSPLTTGFYTIDGSSLGGTLDVINGTATALYVEFTRVRFTGATRHNINLDDNNSAAWRFKHCRIDNAASYGVFHNTAYAAQKFISCEIDNNGAGGIIATSGDRGSCVCYNCSIHDNTGRGVQNYERSGVPSIFIGNVVYNNSSDGVSIGDNGNILNEMLIANNVFHNNGGSGLRFYYALIHWATIVNNTFTNNTSYGVDVDGGWPEGYIDYNLYGTGDAANSSGYSDITPVPGDNNVEGDPLFTSVVSGSEDFTPTSSSPLIDAGAVVPTG